MGNVYSEIKAFHRQRNFAMEQRKSMDLRLGGMIRTQLGWKNPKTPGLAESDLAKIKKANEKIKKEANALMAEDEPSRFAGAILSTRKGREAFDVEENVNRLQMAKLARQLPVWRLWGKDVNGFGEISLAVIIAEAGDLWNYGTRQLRKRMCLMPGQGRVPPGLSKEQRRDEWIKRGYRTRRRSQMWNIGDSMIKAQVRKVKDENGEDTGERVAIGAYGELYLTRKAFEKARNPEISDMHAHRRAQKVMEQRLLEDVRLAWRRTMPRADNIGIGHNSRRGFPKDGYEIPLPPPS